MLISTALLLSMQTANAVNMPSQTVSMADETVLRSFTEQLNEQFVDPSEDRWSIPLGDELSALGVGLELETNPMAFRSISRLSLIVSYDQETVIMRPGGGGVSALTRVAGEVGVADGFAGIGMSLNEHGAVTAGYIRQEREIRFGENSWEAESSFVGLTYRQAW